ncbi:MAG: hypothetical protein AB7L90_25320 [Hyphomicrobiaceae bacterium]
MSNHFNEKAFESIDKITTALIATHEHLPQHLIQFGHLLHRAVDYFAEACFLKKLGGVEIAEDDFRRCELSLRTALELLAGDPLDDPFLDEPDFCEDDTWEKPRFGLIEFCGD